VLGLFIKNQKKSFDPFFDLEEMRLAMFSVPGTIFSHKKNIIYKFTSSL